MGSAVTGEPNRNLAFARALLGELRLAGVRDICIAPGSRSAPLAIASIRESGLRRSVHLDERSAAFFALGRAKATRAPVALLCTSGTAAVNFHPAVVEAYYARVPLVVLTADRPPELRDWGAGQTIDQQRLYGPHVRWFAEVALPGATRLRYARSLACRAVALAEGPPAGPVHLNLPLREPLDPTPVAGDLPADLMRTDPLGARGRGDASYTRTGRPRLEPDPASVTSLARRAEDCERGIVACGPIDATPAFAEAVTLLADALGWPLVADAASSLRGGPHLEHSPIVTTHDLLLRDAELAASLAPDFVLHLGDALTSKAWRLALEARPPRELVRVDPDGTWHDPGHLCSEVVRADPETLCRELSGALDRPAGHGSAWHGFVKGAELRARDALRAALGADDTLLEARATRELAAALPDGALLYVSSSMPIRDLDAFLPPSVRALRVLSNRGANGIDGVLSSALGAATAGAGPTALLTGDLALLHDAGGLLASSRLGAPLAIVVLDNGGGGIFSFLPVARWGDAVAFEELFATPQDVELEALCRAARADFTRITSYEHLRTALKEALSAPRVSVLQVPVDRERNVAQFRSLAALAAAAARGTAE